jgi:hypothetical protein
MEQFGPVYLTEMLFNQTRTTTTETVTLSFARPDELVMIAGSEPDRRSVALSRKDGQFKCDGSTLVVNVSPAKWVRGIAPPLVPVVGGESIVMKVDLVDGFLVVTERQKEFAWLPVPGWSTWSSWYRFRTAPSGGTSQSPKTGQPAPVSARRAMVAFRASRQVFRDAR